MLYGNVIFIKKSGSDGSKFPVTEKLMKIGRSEECIIRIQNPHVAPEHCLLSINENGQAKIKNLSSTNPIILNGKPLGNGEFVLYHNDIFKIGQRYVRWEYLKTSKFCYSTPPIFKHLVAVISPKEKMLADSALSAVKLRLSGRSFRKRCGSDGYGTITRALRHSLGTGCTPLRMKSKSRASLQLTKLTLSPQVKLRKSAGIESSMASTSGTAHETPIGGRPSWKIKSVANPAKGRSPKRGKDRKDTPIKMPPTRSWVRSSPKILDLKTIPESSPAARVSVEKLKSKSAKSVSPKSSTNITETPSPKNIKINTPSKSLPRPLTMKVLPMHYYTESEEEEEEEKGKVRRSSLKKSVPRKDLEDLIASLTKGDAEKKPSVTPGRQAHVLYPVVEITPMKQTGNPDKHKVSPKSSKKTPMKSDRVTRPRQSKTPVTSTPKESLQTSPKGRPKTPARNGGNPGPKKSPQNWERKRKLSALASAERAAKKLKTVAPTKPDKNKKAALLILGKANRKIKSLQSHNIAVKQKLVKKAIKQVTKFGKDGEQEEPQSKTLKLQQSKAKKRSRSGKKRHRRSKKTKSSSESSPSRKPSRERKSKKIEEDSKKKETPEKRDEENRKSSSTSLQPSGSVALGESQSLVPSEALGQDSGTRGPEASGPTSKRLRSRFASDLTPQMTQVSKSAKQFGRRSLSLVTPKMKQVSAAARSASTSRISRKSVRFSYKDPNESSFPELNLTVGTSFDFTGITTPNVTMDKFISPLSERKASLRSGDPVSESPKKEISHSPMSSPTKSEPRSSPRLSRSPRSPKTSSIIKEEIKPPKTSEPIRIKEVKRSQKSPKNDLTDVRGVRRLLTSPKPQKSPRNDLTDVRGVRRLMDSARPKRSPKNDLTCVKGIRRLMKTPRQEKSPKNDLTDVTGVKELFKTRPLPTAPKLLSPEKSTDVSFTGVANLFASPKKETPEKKRRVGARTPSAHVKISPDPFIEKPRLRSAVKRSEKSKDSEIPQLRSRVAPNTSSSGTRDNEPKTRRTTRTTQAAKTAQPTEDKSSRNKSGRETRKMASTSKTSEGSTESKETSKSGSGRRAAKREVPSTSSTKSAKRAKKTDASATEEMPETSSKSAAKTKTEKSKETTVLVGKPSPIRTRRKSIAALSLSTLKRTPSVRARELAEEAGDQRPNTRQRKPKNN